jgi:hypothetical protein
MLIMMRKVNKYKFFGIFFVTSSFLFKPMYAQEISFGVKGGMDIMP